MDAGEYGTARILDRHAGRLGVHPASRLRSVLLNWCGDSECYVPVAVFPLAVFLPDALRIHTYHDGFLVVWTKREAECRVGAESEEDDERVPRPRELRLKLE